MRPRVEAPAAAAPGEGGRRWWKSPFPFITGGVALMLGFIPVAILVIIACCKLSEVEGPSYDVSFKPVDDIGPETEPRVVVVLAGETNPTHIANPVLAFRRGEEV